MRVTSRPLSFTLLSMRSMVPPKSTSSCVPWLLTDDIAIYPIQLNTIVFTLNAKANKQEYRIPFEGIYLYYGQQITSKIEDIFSPSPESSNGVRKMLYNGQLIIIKNNKIYNILGHEITEKY